MAIFFEVFINIKMKNLPVSDREHPLFRRILLPPPPASPPSNSNPQQKPKNQTISPLAPSRAKPTQNPMKTTRILSLAITMAMGMIAGLQASVTEHLPPAPLPEFKTPEQLAKWRAEHTQKTQSSASSQEGGVFYTGKPYLADSGSYAFKYREYNPEMGRWITVDPSGFPDGANNRLYASAPSSALDPDGFSVYWVTSEGSFSPNSTYQALPAATFSWNITYKGQAVQGGSGSFTGTFAQLYQNAGSVGFVTWRGLGPSDFSASQSLELYSRTDNKSAWFDTGYNVTAGFLENVGISDSDISSANSRLNPIGATTSRNTIRGLSSYLYNFLLGKGAGYKGDLFYE